MREPVHLAATRTHRRSRARAGLLSASALLVNTACYSYVPPPGGVLPASGDVLVELTVEGSTAMQSAFGPRIHLIAGRLRATDANGNATIDVEQLTSWDGATVPYVGRDAVQVPRSGIARTDLRTLNRRKSWIVGGVIGGAFLTAVVSALLKARSRNSGSTGKIGASPPDLRAP